VFVVAAAVFAGLLLWGFGGLPRFGTFQGAYGVILDHTAVPERHITDVVTAVNFDYRGFDTLGEEFIFFAAVVGVTVILRAQSDEAPGHIADYAFGRAVPPTSDAVRVLGLGLTPPTILFGLYVIAHGHLTPGGGFQGGVILATGDIQINGNFVFTGYMYAQGNITQGSGSQWVWLNGGMQGKQQTAPQDQGVIDLNNKSGFVGLCGGKVPTLGTPLLTSYTQLSWQDVPENLP